MAKLYLVPITMGESSLESVIPSDVLNKIKNIKTFIVENIRTTRRYLKKIDKSINIDELIFFEINKRTKHTELHNFFVAHKNTDIGVVSEAGCPGIADPGSEVVKLAHKYNMQVSPMVGPSSILMALIASGMNGQNFTFNGYLPVKHHDRVQKIKQLEQCSFKENKTQIFIETPYRNQVMIKDLLANCSKQTKLCIACDISLDTEFIKTKTIAEWEKNIPEINKRPTVFLLHKD
jgi:16S rRNA (cytidine1402-2'-O)-methyltransferase